MNEFDSGIKADQRKGLTLHLVFGSAIAVCVIGYLCWLLLIEGNSIVVSPAEALDSKTIVVSEGVGIAFGDSVYHFGGDLKVAVGAYKFEPKIIQITPLTPSLIEVVLEPSPGIVFGNTNPAEPETLWSIDDKPVHIGAQFKHELAPGNYALAVNSKFYKPYQELVQVQSLEEVNVGINLVPIKGSMIIETIPTGANVIINDEVVGNSPIELDVEGGGYEVQLAKDGYETLIDAIEITNIASQAQRKYQLEPEASKLHIVAQPEDGVLLINGQEKGFGDNSVYANREHRVLYQRDGFYPYSKTFKLKPGESKNIVIKLRPETGKVILSSRPEANIYIDGVYRGAGSLTSTLPAIPHRVEFRKSGFRTVVKEIVPSGKRVSKINIQMLSEFEARRKEGVPLFVDTIGIQMLKYKMTAFTMGSPANEKGRRRNEFQIQVKFSGYVWVGRHEITEAQYSGFDNSKGNTPYPVTDVTWNEAALYCNWLSEQEGLRSFYFVKNGRVVGSDKKSNGYRLPSEAEWEWLAKMAKRAIPTTYIWGNSSHIPKGAGNFGDASISGQQIFVLKGYDDGYADKAPVGSYKADRAGLYDMAGNVSEWVHDFHSHMPPPSLKIMRNYMGPARGVNHILKGGNFMTGKLKSLRPSYKEASEAASATIGFRIARYE